MITRLINKIQKNLGKDPIVIGGVPLSVSEQAAVITHYLQLQNNLFWGNTYANKAQEIFHIWYEALHNDPVAEGGLDAFINRLSINIHEKPFQPNPNPAFTFIDLFAGIGGFRLAFQNLGCTCVFSSEWDDKAQQTYFANYGEVPFGDITRQSTKDMIPEGFDILCAGFPCQAFSLAGLRRGFAETRGTLFFDVADILRTKQPQAFFLENVKGLAIHDKGRTLEVILNTLNEVGYTVVPPQLVNAMYFGVPQHRERIYIVGFRNDLGINPQDFHYPLQEVVARHFIDIREENPVPSKYYLSTTYWNTLLRHRARHEAAGHGFGYAIIPDDGVASAIVVGGMGRERNLVIDNRQQDLRPTTRIRGEYNTQGIRRMTPREWARLQGYPDDFRIEVADASAYKQFGNSVAVPAIQATAEQLLALL